MHLNGSSRIWINFKYEKLPNFCYLCDVLSHVKRDCCLGLEIEGALEEARCFRLWFRLER